jgi:FlaA1/EpsC-like NDP-sugar epimerase
VAEELGVRGVWRYASINDLRRIFWAVAFAAGVIPLLFWMLRLNVILPRSVLVIYPTLLILLMGGGRLIYRLWKEQALFADIKLHGEPVLVLGAGDAAFNLAKDLARNPLWRVVGFLDDDKQKIGNVLNGIRVLGGMEALAQIAQSLGVDKAIIAMPSASHKQRKRAIDLCNAAGIKALTVPSFDDLMSGQVRLSQLREVELDDLLGRDPVQLDDAGLHQQLAGKVILVTGAGGSIGSELCRQIARFSPAKLVLYESGSSLCITSNRSWERNFRSLMPFIWQAMCVMTCA